MTTLEQLLAAIISTGVLILGAESAQSLIDGAYVARDAVNARSDYVKAEAENCGVHLEFTTNWMEGRELSTQAPIIILPQARSTSVPVTIEIPYETEYEVIVEE